MIDGEKIGLGPVNNRGTKRFKVSGLISLALLGLAAMACSAPNEIAPQRPHAVRATSYPQHDATVLGLRLRYVDVGPTAPLGEPVTLVVIPGHTARIEGFDGMLPILSKHNRVLVLDFPGSGYSEKPDRDYTVTFYEDTLIAFLDGLGVQQAVLVGGSLGGNLVLRLGQRFPERFPRLIAWAPGGAWEAQPRLTALVRHTGGRLLFWPTVWIQSRFWYSDDFPGRAAALAETFAYYREVMSPGFVRMYWGIATDLLAHSLFDVAPEIRQPVLLLWGDRDNGANMGEGVARLHQLLPHNQLHVFPGARHSLEAELPKQLADAVDEFVARPATLLP